MLWHNLSPYPFSFLNVCFWHQKCPFKALFGTFIKFNDYIKMLLRSAPHSPILVGLTENLKEIFILNSHDLGFFKSAIRLTDKSGLIVPAL